MGQPKIPATPAGTTLAGKTALITGANSGLGLETARQYLLLGVERLIITARTITKGKEAIQTLRGDPEVAKTNPTATIDAFELELEDYSSVKHFCEQVKAQVPALHILLNNAGITVADFKLSKDGHERTMQVHVYSPLLVSLSLLPLLQSTARGTGHPTHLSVVSSGLHAQSKLSQTLGALHGNNTTLTAHLDDIQNWPGIARYADSKLAATLTFRELARRVQQRRQQQQSANDAAATSDDPLVIINTFCPGLVTTSLGRDLPLWMRPLMWAYRKASARGVEEGARMYVLATAVLGPESHGRFVRDNKIQREAEVVTGEDGQRLTEKLWDEMEEERKRLGM